MTRKTLTATFVLAALLAPTTSAFAEVVRIPGVSVDYGATKVETSKGPKALPTNFSAEQAAPKPKSKSNRRAYDNPYSRSFGLE